MNQIPRNRSIGQLTAGRSKQVKNQLDSMLRVNQAGELGAVRIYQGQLFILNRRSQKQRQLLKHMLNQEQVHRDYFNQMVSSNNVRPTLFTPIWHVAGFVLGATSALLGGERGAMLCTEAVETVIGRHYNDQIREIYSLEATTTTTKPDDIDGSVVKKNNDEHLEKFRKQLAKFRDEELEHLDTAVDNGSQTIPILPQQLFSSLIKAGCHGAIWLSKRF